MSTRVPKCQKIKRVG